APIVSVRCPKENSMDSTCNVPGITRVSMSAPAKLPPARQRWISKPLKSKCAKAKSVFFCRVKRNRHDPKTEIRLSFVFAEEESEDRQAPQSRHIQDQSRRQKTRESCSVFQAALNCAHG